MVKSKKILSLALALVMALGVLTMGVFAAKTTPTATFTVSASPSEVATGDEVTITVKANATETFYAGPMSLPIEYNASLFEYVADSATVANIYGESTTKSAVKAEAGKLTVALTPSTSGAVTAPDLNGANLTVLTFKLKAIGSTGSSTVAIADDQKTAANIGGKFYCGSFDSANPKTAELTEIGQTLNRVDTTISYKGGAVEAADLELTAKGTEDGVVIDTRITFGGQYDGAVYGFKQVNATTFRANNNYITNSVQATNEGSLSIARSFNTAGWSTGTIITVLNKDGSESKKYIVIIFGDVNCDGLINGNDTTACKNYIANPATLTRNEVRMAANCQNVNKTAMLYILNGNDTTAIKNYVANNSLKVSQATLAQTFSSTAVHEKYK